MYILSNLATEYPRSTWHTRSLTMYISNKIRGIVLERDDKVTKQL